MAIDVCEGDLLIFDQHVLHCNNPLKGEGRVSFVIYLREKLDKCEK